MAPTRAHPPRRAARPLAERGRGGRLAAVLSPVRRRAACSCRSAPGCRRWCPGARREDGLRHPRSARLVPVLRRAAARGAIVVEATGIRDVPSGPLLRIGHDRFLPGLESLARVVREASGGHTRLFIQLIDFLAIRAARNRRRTSGAIPGDHRAAPRVPRHAGGEEDAVRARLLALPPRRPGGGAERTRARGAAHGLPRAGDGRRARARARRSRRRSRRCLHRPPCAPARPASTAWSCTTRTPTPWPRSSRRPTRARTAMAASPRNACACRWKCSRAVRAALGRDYAGRLSLARGRVHRRRHRHRRLPPTSPARSRAPAWTSCRSRAAASSMTPCSRRWARPPIRTPAAAATSACPPITPTARGPFGRNLRAASAAIRAAVRAAGLATPDRRRRWHPQLRAGRRRCSSGRQADIVGLARQALADPDWFRKVRRRPRRRSAALPVHQLLRGARPAPPPGDLRAVGPRGRGLTRCRGRRRRQAPPRGPALGEKAGVSFRGTRARRG